MRLTTRVERLHLRHTFTISRSSRDEVPVVLAELESGGTVGVGEASPSAFYGEDVESVDTALGELDDLLASGSPACHERLLAAAAERLGGRRSALCALDLAVHDWNCRQLGQPLDRLLGLDSRDAPASSFTIGIDTVDRMVDKLREAREYPIIKVKLGTPRDIEILRALRAETDAVFRVDANCAWSAEEAIEKSGELKALGVEFIEQPLPPDRLEEMGRVYRESSLPVVADESAVVPEDIPRLQGRFHGVNIKLNKCGGIRPALRMVHVARTLGMQVMFGCMIESSVGIHAAARIGALADWLDLDGNVLISDDPYGGMENRAGRLLLPPLTVERRRAVE